jgi:hypothetical protein
MTPPKVIALEEHFTSPKLRALRGEKDMPVQRKRSIGHSCPIAQAANGWCGAGERP